MISRRAFLAGSSTLLAEPGAVASEGQLTWAVHFAIAPTWFDPGEHQGFITAMVAFYALHDAERLHGQDHRRRNPPIARNGRSRRG